MTSNDNEELNSILKNVDDSRVDSRARITEDYNYEKPDENKFSTNATQWSTSNGVVYIPTGKTVDVLQPGYYEIASHQEIGVYFEKIAVKTHGLLEFPDANTSKVIHEIKKFWNSESIFRSLKLAYQRGIILWGPAGGGKSCTLQLVSQDVIKRGGVVIKFTSPGLFISGIRKLREIQPDTPIVVLMEDIDSIIWVHSETEVINILDGVNKIDKIVYLATTNYPEKLGQRIMNRPSRFDKRYKVGYPSEESRKLYLNYLINGHTNLNIDVDKWAKDTEWFSIAHLKELFVAVVVFEDDYNETIQTLRTMKMDVVSWSDEEKKSSVGF